MRFMVERSVRNRLQRAYHHLIRDVAELDGVAVVGAVAVDAVVAVAAVGVSAVEMESTKRVRKTRLWWKWKWTLMLRW